MPPVAVQTVLPPNATSLERGFDQAVGLRMDALEVPIEGLHDAAAAPEAVLPWLAWEAAVDVWSDAWTLPEKRSAVAGAWAAHRRKGTPAAVRDVLDAAGAVYTLAEGTGAQHHTMAIDLTDVSGLTVTVDELRDRVAAVSRVSVHVTITEPMP